MQEKRNLLKNRSIKKEILLKITFTCIFLKIKLYFCCPDYKKGKFTAPEKAYQTIGIISFVKIFVNIFGKLPGI